MRHEKNHEEMIVNTILIAAVGVVGWVCYKILIEPFTKE